MGLWDPSPELPRGWWERAGDGASDEQTQIQLVINPDLAALEAAELMRRGRDVG